MDNRFERTELLFGKTAMKRINSCRVAIFGIGGVGGYVTEALVRSGIGAVDLIDNDKVSLTNINRQIIATGENVGEYKTDAAQKRIKEINPDCKVKTHRVFFLPDTSGLFDFKQYDYVVDAIDNVTGKLEIITKAKEAGVPVISAMGAGNKTDPTAFKVADIYETNLCPLARVMRRECRKRGIDGFKTVYSTEIAKKPIEKTSETKENGREIPGSVAFVPSVAGLIIAGEVIKDLIGFVE